MTCRIAIAEHMQLAETIWLTAVIFATCVVTLLVVGVVLAERMDDDGNY